MDSVLSKRSIGISELREAPSRVFAQAGDEAIVVLNRNKPAGYIVSTRLMRAIFDAMVDGAVSTKAAARVETLSKARRISVDEL